MAIDPGDGSGIAIFAAAPAADPAPSIRADVHGSEVVVSADGPVVQATDTRASSISDALGHWAGWYASAAGVALRQRTPTAWCSWYHYLAHVNHDDILENLAAMDRLGLDVALGEVSVMPGTNGPATAGWTRPELTHAPCGMWVRRHSPDEREMSAGRAGQGRIVGPAPRKRRRATPDQKA